MVAFRRHTVLALDDCLYGLQPTIRTSPDHRCTGFSNGTASALHRR